MRRSQATSLRGSVVTLALEGLQTRAEPGTGEPPALAIRPHLQAPNPLRHPRSSAETPASAQGRAPARARTTRNPPQHQRLRKRHPRLRHQAQNLRRNGQPKRPAGPRRDARPRQDLQETENFLLRLPRRPPWHSRARNPPARDPRQPRPKLTAARKFAPVTLSGRKILILLVPQERFELPTPSLRILCSDGGK